MTTIYLIRHAEADGNVYRRIHGWYDGFVTPRGYMQIQKLHERFSQVHIDAVYSSDMYRTRETARAVSEAHGLEIIPRTALREINLGDWEDIPWGEAMVNRPAEYSVWEKNPDKFKIHGSESYGEIYERAKAELDRIAAQHPNSATAVVTHGTVIRAILCMLLRRDMSQVSSIPWCDNTGVAKLSVSPEMEYTVEYSNDNSHLRELSTLGRQRWWKDDADPYLCNLHFVPARFPQDLDRADAYYRESWSAVFPAETYDARYTRARFIKLAAAHPEAVVFARRGDGTEVGILTLDTHANLLRGGGHITLLYLNADARGMELGAQLLGHAVSVYRALGRRIITVRAAEKNTRALNFYKKYGFVQFGSERTENGLQLLLCKPIDGTPADIIWK